MGKGRRARGGLEEEDTPYRTQRSALLMTSSRPCLLSAFRAPQLYVGNLPVSMIILEEGRARAAVASAVGERENERECVHAWLGSLGDAGVGTRALPCFGLPSSCHAVRTNAHTHATRHDLVSPDDGSQWSCTTVSFFSASPRLGLGTH